MLKDATYKEKFELLSDWMPLVVDSVKKDLRNEHLKKDYGFAKKYLPSKNLNKVTTEELTEAYRSAVSQEPKAEEIVEFIFNRWLLKHTEVYQFFEDSLQRISPNFMELTEIGQNESTQIMKSAVSLFGATNTYLFAVINSVVFPKSVFEELLQQAKLKNVRLNKMKP